MSVIIRLQNLPWSANALDIRNFFRGLSIPEGGVHIVGGELGDAFIAFSTDEDARQAMMLDGGKIKEIQVHLLLSSRSEMHKVIEAARQTVPILSLPTPAPAPQPTPVIPTISPFTPALHSASLGFGIPGIGNPQEIPQPAVIEPPPPLISPPVITVPNEDSKDSEKAEPRKRDKDRVRTRSRTRSRSRSPRDRKERKRDRRDRSRSRDRRRRERSRSRDRRDRKRDRKEHSRDLSRSPIRRSRDKRNNERVSSPNADKVNGGPTANMSPNLNQMKQNFPPMNQNGPDGNDRFNDPNVIDTLTKLQEIGKKRNPNAFQGEQNGSSRFGGGIRNTSRGGNSNNTFRRDGRQSRFDNDVQSDCCVAIRNAPNHTSYGDVRRFFPFMIDKHGIKMINDPMGRRTGNIYVRFCDTRSRQLALQRKHNELKGAQVTVEVLPDDEYDDAVDSFLPYRDDNNGGEEPNLVVPPAIVHKPFCVLKLTDLPHFIKEHDIIKMFSDFSLLSIMINDDKMTRTKIAYVQFVNPDDAKVAFDRKDKYVFGRRKAVITSITNEEYEVEKQRSGNEKEPETASEPISSAPEPLIPELVVPRDPRQRRQVENNGAGPGQMAIAMQPQAFLGGFPAMQQFGTPFNPQFGGFPGPVNLDPRSAAAKWAAENNPGKMAMPAGNQVIDLDEETLDCVLMKGLPKDATDRTIVKFLSDTGAVPARIHLMLDTNGMPSGDCFCEFRSSQEARLAAQKHDTYLEGCRVTVDLVGRTVVEEALEGPKPRSEPLLSDPIPQFFDVPQRGGFVPRGRGRGGFDRGGMNNFRGNFDQGRGYERGGRGFNSSRGSFDQSRGGFDQSRGGFDQSRGGFDQGRGGYEPRGGYRGRGGFSERGSRGMVRGRGRGFNRGRGGFDNSRESNDGPIDEQDPALQDFGLPGCVVSMENVPFRASVDEILTFFSEFDLSQDDVIRRYNERGQPTGDARVAFKTPFDAQRAVKTRHMDTIHDRRISLNIL